MKKVRVVRMAQSLRRAPPPMAEEGVRDPDLSGESTLAPRRNIGSAQKTLGPAARDLYMATNRSKNRMRQHSTFRPPALSLQAQRDPECWRRTSPTPILPNYHGQDYFDFNQARPRRTQVHSTEPRRCGPHPSGSPVDHSADAPAPSCNTGKPTQASL